MSLAKLNIQDLVERCTSDYIYAHTSDYSALRNPCILPLPVTAVTDAVAMQLVEMLSQDKQTSSSKIILKACKKQQEQDFKENEADHQKEMEDWREEKHLKGQLQEVNEQIRKNKQEIEHHQEQIKHIQVLLQRVDEQITIPLPHSEDITHHHSHSETETSPHNHTHPKTTAQHDSTEHTHPSTKQHAATTHTPISPEVHTSPSHLNATQHGHPTSQLELQKKELHQTLNSHEIDLRNKKLACEGMIRHQKLIEEKLLKLPLKENQRKERALERDYRNQARLYNDPNLLQLSQENRSAVNAAIELEHKKLIQLNEQLLRKAKQISYQIYLNMLENLIDRVIKLNYPENQALKQIIRFMKDYLETKEIEYVKKGIMDEAQRSKSQLVKKLDEHEKKIEQFKKSNPELASANSALEEENKRLEISIENSRNTRNTLAKAGLFSLLFTGGATGTGLAIEGGLIALTSLVFAPAALLAVITLSIFIVALVYAINASIDQNKLDNNKSTIELNCAKIIMQNSEIHDLEAKKIPEVKTKISKADKEILKATADYVDIYGKAELKLECARKVEVIYPSRQIFLSEPSLPPINHDNYKPTAPEIDNFTGYTSTHK
ncbi:hypothetical protein [Legionella sp. PC997]|uniref:hypothetical protein n=1 Tax=Legionella sp. PC997 TaxID=2755562 RepID=UPI0015FE7D6B|nr:hypothetical protein [Legionella sp. PC997]QMT60502.1 hypothetical protein HBNCFIEN_01874 [Legionella sp. PC997]